MSCVACSHTSVERVGRIDFCVVSCGLCVALRRGTGLRMVETAIRATRLDLNVEETNRVFVKTLYKVTLIVNDAIKPDSFQFLQINMDVA